MTEQLIPEEFLDNRKYNFIRVALVIPRVHLANPLANANETLEYLVKASDAGVSYALCPELGLTGYSNQDLFFNRVLLDEALEALEVLQDANSQMMFSVGMPLRVNGAIYNCAVTIQGRSVLAVTPKSYPPEGNEFYEGRHFGRAPEATVDEVTILGNTVPFGNDIIIVDKYNPLFQLHTEVCEDLWVPISPSTKAVLGGATILANLSASNITIGKAEYRENLVVGSSARNFAVQMYCAAGFGESSTDLAWDGDGYIAERGILLAQADRFSLEGGIVIQDVDLEVLETDRMKSSSFRQCATDNQFPVRHVECSDPGSCENMELRRNIDQNPFVPSDPARRSERCRETFMIQATSLARRLMQLPEHLRKLIIGISGGLDSTHSLLVAVHAMDLLKIDRSNIIGITMPGLGTSDRTKGNAIDLMKALGVTSLEIPVVDLSFDMFKAIEKDPEHVNLTYQNVQAWMRKHVELATACEREGIVLGTGDLSELALGWCTMFGDHASHYNVNGGVPKTLIQYLVLWAADEIFEENKLAQVVLRDIVDTPISPELEPTDEEGKIAQETEDIIGPYELHDFFLYWFVRFGFTPTKIVRMALHAYEGKYDVVTIKKWLRVFLTRFFIAQVKRSCLPDGPKVGLTSLSPRGDWRMPSDANVDAWIRNLDKIPDQLD